MEVARSVDYLQTITSLQQVLQDLEANLDKVRAEEENEWKVRFDIHLQFKRCVEMRLHRSVERLKDLRAALRDGGLEFHPDYRMSTEHSLQRLVYNLQKQRKEKLEELEKKEDILDRDSKVLQEERKRRKFLQQEFDTLKLGSDGLFWNETSRPATRTLFKYQFDDASEEAAKRDFDGHHVERRLSRGQLPII